MQLLSLTLTNFRGLREFSVDFDGKSVEIYGKNGTGKTTIANAIWWALYGKALDGEKNFTPKTREGETDVHGLSHSAELVVKTADGVVIALKKIFSEKYTKTKGAAEAAFDGHTIDHFIDDVPVKEKEYLARVADIIGDPERAKILSNVYEFAGNMGWEERRKILIDVCGDVTDADVIAANPDLAELPRILAMPGDSGRQYTIDEYLKITKAKLVEIRREKDTIQPRIDEAKLAIAAIPENPPKDVYADLAAISKLIADADVEIVNARAAKTDDAAAELRLKIKGVEMEIATARTAHAKTGASANEGALSKIAELSGKIHNIADELGTSEVACATLTRKIADMVTRRDELQTSYAEVKAMVWDSAQETCPTCSRELEPDKIEATRAEFNRKKAEKLAAITAKGKKECDKVVIAQLETQRDGHRAEADAKIRERADLLAERDALRASIDGKATVPFESTDGYKALAARLADLGRQEQAGAAAAVQSNAAKIAEVEAKKAEMVKERDRLNAIKAAIEGGVKQEGRIKELKAKKKALAVEDETLQRNIHICELFDTAKMSMLDESINSKFTAVKFRMFVVQLNGGIRKDCEVLVPSKDKTAWVPFSGGSNRGANANAGLEIISVLSKHWGQRLPVVVDNAESVSDWVDTGVQLIQLIVTRDDDKLRVTVRGDASGEVARVA